MSKVELRGVVKRYGDVLALDTLNIEIQEGEFLSLLGPSGCGKTTALRLIAGFLRPNDGQILMDGEDLTHVPTEHRNIGMVFQDYALFPHLTVAENVAFGLVERRHDRDRIARRVADMLSLVRLDGLGGRYPAALSGGQRQRVAMARALALSPRVLLMDEPLGALDLKLRETMQDELYRLQRELGITTIYVTHDQGEAIRMSHRIAVMNAGRLEQLGTPEEIYRHPQNRFVAQFVGRVNFLAATPAEEAAGSTTVMVAGQTCRVERIPNSAQGSRLTLAIRPEAISLLPRSGLPVCGQTNALPGRVVERVFAGAHIDIHVRLDNNEMVIVEAPAAGHAGDMDEAWIAFDPAAATVLSDEQA